MHPIQMTITYPVGSLVGDISNEGGGDLELELSE